MWDLHHGPGRVQEPGQRAAWNAWQRNPAGARGSLETSELDMRTTRTDSLALLATALAAAALGACATEPPRTPEERAADTLLAQQVEAALDGDPRIYARHVNVTSDRGVVTLTGMIWSNEDYLLAKRDAEGIPGVVRVNASMDLVRGGISGTSR